jgi:(1->4)-alpha-D-glucan 1-alpha-D-glucosylmutase
LADLKQRGEHDQLALARELMETSPDGRIKLYLIHRVLGCRRAHEQLFAHGGYRPLKAHGEQSEHVCAFARTEGDAAVVVVVPRLVAGLTGRSERPPLGAEIWGNTTLALPQSLADKKQACYRNIFTGEVLAVDEHDGEQRLRLADIFGHFPVALFERAV